MMTNGILVIDKQKGYTSHDCVAICRKMFNTKAGHAGTLDPDATGVLPILLGKATKLSNSLMSDDKIYKAEVILGFQTDTGDKSGKIIKTAEYELDEIKIKQVLKNFTGTIMQTPPMYSAIKINGKKLYELARKGKTIERPSREIEIFDIELLEFTPSGFFIRVHCSKGTYIRVLCEDIAYALNTVGCMGSLVREASGQFTLKDAVSIEKIKEMGLEDALKYIILEELLKNGNNTS